MPKNSDNKSFVFYLLTKLTKIFIIGIYLNNKSIYIYLYTIIRNINNILDQICNFNFKPKPNL